MYLAKVHVTFNNFTVIEFGNPCWFDSHCSSSRLKSGDELELALWTSLSFHPGAKVARLVRLQAN